MTDSQVPGPESARPGPLSGVTVLDLGQIYNGPYATFLMAMAGADVIKIEPPGGENLRRRTVVGGGALPFAMLNSNKRCLVLDLKSESGRELLQELVRKADVLLENFAPGVLTRLGVGYEALSAINPRLIYASGSGYGLSGPYRDYPAMDLTVQAMAGVMSVTGFPDKPPVRSGPAVCDFFGGVHLCTAVSMALFERERTGLGRLVEVAMIEAVYASLSSNLGMWYGSGGKAPSRTGNRHGGLAESPYNVYPTKDGHIAVIGVTDEHWRRLARTVGRPELADDPRFSSLKERVAHMDEVDALVAAFTKDFDKQELFELLNANRVPCAPVRDLDEVVNDAHLRERGFLNEVSHPRFGNVVLPSSPLRFQDTPLRELVPSGDPGEHSAEVLADMLGLGPAEIEDLRRRKVI